MKKSKIRSHLRWLIPIVIYICMLAAVLVTFKNDIHKKAVDRKQQEISLAICSELQDIDLSLSRAMSYVESTSKALSFYAMEYNQGQVEVLLKNIIDNTNVSAAYVCDYDGNGYDERGTAVSLGEKRFFADITQEYSRGGSGMVRPDETSEEGDKEVLLVSHVTFDKKEGGYLIAKLPIESLSDKIFMDKYPVEEAAVVTLDGQIISRTVRAGLEDGDEPTLFWDILPMGLSRDTIKLSISQKNSYMAEVPNYGYVLVLPLREAGGGAVVLIRYEQMKYITSDENTMFLSFAVKILVISLFLLLMIIAANIISDILEDKLRQKRLSGIEIDPATGLLTKTSAEQQIKQHIENPDSNGGLLFIIGIEGVKKDTEMDIKIADARRHAFAKALSSNFRASDILARVGDDSYMVFLRNVRSDKDVRKQTDEMQMFLHDVEHNDDEGAINAHAGAALCPDNGRTVGELIDSAKAAYERSKEAGAGRLSF